MKRVNKRNKEQLVRIIIGSSQTGEKGIHKPIKTITLMETSVDEIFKKLNKFLDGEEI